MSKKIKILIKLLDDGEFAIKIRKNYKDESTSTILQLASILELTKNSYLKQIGSKDGR